MNLEYPNVAASVGLVSDLPWSGAGHAEILQTENRESRNWKLSGRLLNNFKILDWLMSLRSEHDDRLADVAPLRSVHDFPLL